MWTSYLNFFNRNSIFIMKIMKKKIFFFIFFLYMRMGHDHENKNTKG